VFLAVTSGGWGLNFPIMKYLLSEWPPLSSRGLSGMVGAAALALVAALQHQRLAVPRRMWLRLVLASLLTISAWVAFMGLALVWLDAREAAVLAISVPVWVALLAWPVLGERLSPLRAAALMVALGGIFILIGGNSIDAGIGKLPGLLMALTGAVCVGLGTVLTKHFPLRDAADLACGLADRYRVPAGCHRRAAHRAAAARCPVVGRLGVNDLHDADPVLPVLRLLVRRARTSACGHRLNWHAARAGC
jgi:drug/metabolite transporter (DMT)-like permease